MREVAAYHDQIKYDGMIRTQILVMFPPIPDCEQKKTYTIREIIKSHVEQVVIHEGKEGQG
jgi:hypothetical protein